GLWLSTIVVISLAFWLSLNDVERTMQPWALRKSLLYYTGVVAMAMISIGMILALRLPFLERLTGGLDRSYRLHKWVGITGALFALMHWLIKTQPKALVRQGWIDADVLNTPATVIGFFDDPNPFIAWKQIAKSAGE